LEEQPLLYAGGKSLLVPGGVRASCLASVLFLTELRASYPGAAGRPTLVGAYTASKVDM
jgi:hypothetical protein